MDESWEQFGLGVLSGEKRGTGPSLLRGLLRSAEPFYSGAMRLRNALYDRQCLRTTQTLPRPTISIGNITAGGTGKTPMVRWLADRLRDTGMTPCILLRGYKSDASGQSDELAMLEAHLNTSHANRVFLRADPSRIRAADAMIRSHPEIDVFLLDDAFQHRRAARDFDLVLISAVAPFGYDHVHPRGLLREPLSGLHRASALVITRSDAVDQSTLETIESRLRRHSAAPIHRASHALTTVRTPDGPRALDDLSQRRCVAFCGIGDPQSFEKQASALPGSLVATKSFPDHHHYTPGDLCALQSLAAKHRADLLLTTEKDWIKLAPLADQAPGVPIWRLDMEIRFVEGDEDALFQNILAAIDRARRR